ncbi:MAG: phosphoribosylformylglycinamidine cyclo-ligase [Bacteroidota bacterium]
MGKTYKESGVDIHAGDEVVNKIKPLIKSTFNKNVLADIGLFGGFYEADFKEYDDPVLVASTDGVGTKLKVAFASGKHYTVGHCLVNHCTDDILSCGARPLFFLDYFATGKLSPEVAEQVITGFVNGCKENSCALIGGETAEMPSIYSEGEYDISGTIVGIVDKNKIVNGSSIKPGNTLIGLNSSGLHTNGYSLARNVLFSEFAPGQYLESLGTTVAEALLAVHKSYLKQVLPLVDKGAIKGISHITGGGIIGNTKRILPEGTNLDIHWDSWQWPEIFKLIQKTGDVDTEEMRHVFNLGIGMILVVDESDADEVIRSCSQDDAKVIGRIIKA